MNEVIACPSCQRKVTVPVTFFGKMVQCPQCQHTFTAIDPTSAVEPAAPPTVRLAPIELDPWEDSGRTARPRRDRFEPDYVDELNFRRTAMPHRGPAILTIGILSLVIFIAAPVLGPIAWVMGHTDLRLMRSGSMDRTGEGPTQAGMILGVVTTVLSAIVLGLICMGSVFDSMHRV